MKNGNNFGQKLLNWLQKILLAPVWRSINLWQKILSPDHSWRKIYYPYGACRFYPTCSEYSKSCLAEWGYKGLWLSLKRIARCHPWSAGGLDLPPKRRERNLESGI